MYIYIYINIGFSLLWGWGEFPVPTSQNFGPPPPTKFLLSPQQTKVNSFPPLNKTFLFINQ